MGAIDAVDSRARHWDQLCPSDTRANDMRTETMSAFWIADPKGWQLDETSQAMASPQVATTNRRSGWRPPEKTMCKVRRYQGEEIATLRMTPKYMVVYGDIHGGVHRPATSQIKRAVEPCGTQKGTQTITRGIRCGYLRGFQRQLSGDFWPSSNAHEATKT
jgi:hypothetical protein